jgi:hypothetical protein
MTTKECNILKERLNRIVTSIDKLHTPIEERYPLNLQIIEGLGLMLKVKLKEKTPPCVVTIMYEKEEDSNTVEAFYST